MTQFTEELKVKIATRYQRIEELVQEYPQPLETIFVLMTEIKEFEKMLNDRQL